MHAAADLPGEEKPGYGRLSAGIVLQPAILVVEGGVNQHRLPGDIYAETSVNDEFARELPLHRTFAHQYIDHRRVKPYAQFSGGRGNALSPFQTFPDDSGRFHIPRLALIDELLPILIDYVGPRPSEFFRNQNAFNLLGEDGTGGVVLDSMQQLEFHAGPVAQNDAISRSPIVIGGHKPLNVQSTAATSGDNGRPSPDYQVFFGFQIVKHGAGAVAVFVQKEFDGG